MKTPPTPAAKGPFVLRWYAEDKAQEWLAAALPVFTTYLGDARIFDTEDEARREAGEGLYGFKGAHDDAGWKVEPR